jgi:hypothetical protein
MSRQISQGKMYVPNIYIYIYIYIYMPFPSIKTHPPKQPLNNRSRESFSDFFQEEKKLIKLSQHTHTHTHAYIHGNC